MHKELSLRIIQAFMAGVLSINSHKKSYLRRIKLSIHSMCINSHAQTQIERPLTQSLHIFTTLSKEDENRVGKVIDTQATSRCSFQSSRRIAEQGID